MAISVQGFFEKTWKKFLNLAGQAAASTAAEMPEVQQKMKQIETKRGKDILWKIFPFILVAILLFILVKAFK